VIPAIGPGARPDFEEEVDVIDEEVDVIDDEVFAVDGEVFRIDEEVVVIEDVVTAAIVAFQSPVHVGQQSIFVTV